MNQVSGHFASIVTRIGRGGCVALLLLLVSGCAALTPPKVDPYSTLLPAGAKLVDATASFSAPNLKQDTVYLVVGSNFVTYAEMWNKGQKFAEEYGGGISYSKADFLEWQARWSPARTTSLVVAVLQKHFRNVVSVTDLAEAQAKSAKWTAMFDVAHVVPSAMTCSWTNSTSIDLLDGKFRRVAAVTVSQDKNYGMPLTDGAVHQCQRDRGEDLVRNVNAALVQFDIKLAAAAQKR